MILPATCDRLPAAFWLDQDYRRLSFEQRLETLGTDDSGWIVIARCRDCGQYWRVDRPDKYSVDLAIKVSRPDAWTDDDDRRVRLEYLRHSYGGEDAHKCVWAGCPNRALKGVAMCAEHLFDRMGQRAKGA
jgi:hypothetical protein